MPAPSKASKAYEYLQLNGAGERGVVLNGIYKREPDLHNKKVFYRKVEGEGVLYFDGIVWKIGRVNKLFWIYCAEIAGPESQDRPPCEGWTQMAQVDPVWARTPGLAPTNLAYKEMHPGISTERAHANPPPTLEFKTEEQMELSRASMPKQSKRPARREGLDLNAKQLGEATRRWGFFRQRYVVDNKAGKKLLEVIVERSQGEVWGIEKIVRKQVNGNPGLVVWEPIDKGRLGEHNTTAASHRKIRQFSVITMINGTCFTAEMIAEIHTAHKLVMTVRVPQTDKFADLVEVQRIKVHVDKSAKAGQHADSACDPAEARPAQASGPSASSIVSSEQDDSAEAQQGDEIGSKLRKSLAKRAMKKQEEDNHEFKADEQMQIEDFFRDPESWAVLQHMMQDAASSGTHRAHSMRSFLEDIQTYHFKKLQENAKGVFSGMVSVGSSASGAASGAATGCCASARGADESKKLSARAPASV